MEAAYNKRFLWFKEDGKEAVRHELHNTDAVHALNVDPEHWSVEKPADAAPEPKPAEIVADNGEDFGGIE